jgi:hypothetical protein
MSAGTVFLFDFGFIPGTKKRNGDPTIIFRMKDITDLTDDVMDQLESFL